MSEETKPTVLVYPGLEFGETEKSARRYTKMLPHRRFNIIVKSARWKDPSETISDKLTRIRDDIQEVAQKTGRPAGVVAVSASGPLILEAASGLDQDTVGAIATIASPLDARGINLDSLPEKMKKKLQRQSPVFVEFAKQLLEKGKLDLAPELLTKILNIYGTRDKSVPPNFSMLESATNRQFWTPWFPAPGKLGFITHAYNIARGLKTPQLSKFLSEKLSDN